jgi:ABC-type sugar transport system permease subunit
LKIKASQKENIIGWAIITPLMLYQIIFTAIPLFGVIILSFTKWDGIQPNIEFVGFGNYIKAFDFEYAKLLGTTAILAFSMVGIGMILGFLFASLINSDIKGKGVFRSIWYIPCVVSMAITSQLVNVLILPTEEGTINIILKLFGISPIAWQQSSFWMFFWLIAINIWKGLGGTIILYLAGLSGISKEIYEASDIDGASPWQKLWRITMPLLRPMHVFVLVTAIIGSFQMFEPVQLITRGGPNGATKVIVYQIYDEAFKNFQMGFASSLSLLLMIVLMTLTYFNMKLSKID